MNKIKPYIIGAVAGILLVVVLGGAAYIAYKTLKPLTKKIITKLSNMRFNSLKKATNDLVIADFETPEDFKKFEDSNVEVAVSKEYPSSGAYCAKVTFKKSKSPSFKIEHYFEKDKSLSNWAPYGSFLFDIYNPQDSPQRLILQIKDKSGERYKQDVTIEPNAKETIEIETAALRHPVSIFNIAQVNLFRWEPQSDSVFYVDNLRLAPQGVKIKKSIFDPEFLNAKEPVYATGDYFSFPLDRWQKVDAREFPIIVMNPTSLRFKDLPARGGIPFPKGELTSKNGLAIKDGQGNSLPYQSKVMAKWNDGSIKWLLLDFPASAEPGLGGQYTIDYPVKQDVSKQNTFVFQTGDQVIVDTGKVKFSVSKKAFRLFDRIWIGGKEVVSAGSDLTMQFRGKVYRSSGDKKYILTIEEGGPLVVGLKAEGWFVDDRGRQFCKFLTRIKAYRGESFVRVYHTFIYTGYPENTYHYLYKGKRLPKNGTIEEAAISLRIPEVIKEGVVTFAADNQVLQKKDIDADLKILQKKDDHFEVFKAKDQKIGEGKKLEGWVDVANGQKGVCAVVRKLWQQFPKGFEVDPKEGTLVLKLWPKEAGDMDLKTTAKTLGPEDVARGSAFGLAKTHELVFYFYSGDYKSSKAREIALSAQEPPLVLSSPAWLSDTKALGAVSDYSKGLAYFQKYEDSLEHLFDWADRQKKTFKWYGMLDFGDTLSWYRQEGYDESYDEAGWHPVGRWGWFNCEGVGAHMGALLQFARTGNYKYFEFGEDLSRHMMDVDTCHFNTVAFDKRLKGIYKDYSQPGSMHRHSGDHWGGRNEEASHTNLNGILLYYYITGNDRALDVAKETGEFFLKHPITYFKHPDIAPNRGMANILMGEVALYEATGDERLKKDADYWADMFFQGQNRNGSFNEDYNPRDKRWDGDPHIGYMNGYTLPALIDYHKLTGNKAIKETIVKLTDYLSAHDEYGAISEGLAYSYFLTGDKKYQEITEKRLESMTASQRTQDDPLMNGMIYQKPYYARVVEFLYFTPYAFEALLAAQNAPRSGLGPEQRGN